MRFLQFLSLLAAMIVLPLSAQAGQGLDGLDSFLKNMKTLQGEFVQIQFNADRRETQRASGTLEMSRPGKFRWVYAQPYHQELVADGESLWIYDQDLEQVTQKPLLQATAQAPIMLLLEKKSLDKDYLLTDLGSDQGLDWVGLKPRKDEADVREVKLAFEKKMLARMQLTDAFGQITLIEFKEMKLNPKLPENAFAFVPPAGVDVVRAAQ
ncbi:MAG: outer membrane lipoprotein carrier protein LolA [Gammaproteobacteria bacterium 28-57-27]|nr:MAG: outer membrane lipoprotein carrier protein LolA [Gammaproteobacteria bacterium 28-57-27]